VSVSTEHAAFGAVRPLGTRQDRLTCAKLYEVIRKDFFEQLLALDERSLHAQWQTITEEIADVQKEERELGERRRKLEARRAMLDAIAKVREAELPPERRRATVDADSDSFSSGPRATAFAIFEENPTTQWDSEAMRAALKDRGYDSTLSNARVLMQRLVRDGRARRVGRGLYQSVRGDASTLLTPQEDEQ
jgi:hypothetical protein